MKAEASRTPAKNDLAISLGVTLGLGPIATFVMWAHFSLPDTFLGLVLGLMGILAGAVWFYCGALIFVVSFFRVLFGHKGHLDKKSGLGPASFAHDCQFSHSVLFGKSLLVCFKIMAHLVWISVLFSSIAVFLTLLSQRH